MVEPLLELPVALEAALRRGHQWVYRNHVAGAPAWRSGQWVRLRAGRFEGWGLWDADSALALRVFSSGVRPDEALVRARVADAWALREPLRARRDTTAYRVLFGEGDRLPGVVADLYAGYVVLALYSPSVEPLVSWVVAGLVDVAAPRGILLRGERGLTLLAGSAPPRDLVVLENGLRLRADLASGQKTGLFLDHRENRAWLAPHCAERTVLDLYAYTGAFSLAAARAGARRVLSVDQAAPALEASRANFRLNGLDEDAQETLASDVPEALARFADERRLFEVVINDPPSFASSRVQRERAVRAYTKIHAAALRVTASGGLYAAASCTAQVSPEDFRGLLAEAASAARVTFQTIHEAGQALDHPVLAGHPESRYLKFVVGRVLR